MSFSRQTTCALVVLVAFASTAAAQAGLATITLTITLPDGAPAIGARVEAVPAAAGAARNAMVTAEQPIVVLPLSPGSQRLRVELAGFRAAEQTQDLQPGTERRLAVRLAPEAGMGNSTISVEGRLEPTYQTGLAPEWLTDLPSAGTLWSLLETAHPFVISDRMDNGGLWSARAARLGGSGPSWNQTQFRLEGLDVTDARDGGAPAIYPDLGVLDAINVETARFTAGVPGPGPVITLVPRRPSEVWTGTGQAFVTPGAWQPDPVAGGPPALGRFDHWTDAAISTGGPIANRAGLFASIRGTHASRLERGDPLVLLNKVASLYGHLVGTAGPDRELRLTTALSRETRPFEARARYAGRDIDERGRMVLGQATVEQLRGGQLFEVSGGFHRVSNDPQVETATPGGYIDRLVDGPPMSLVDATVNTISQRWTLAASISPAPGAWLNPDHRLRFGAALSGSRASNTALSQPAFGELVDGVPARVWDVRWKGTSTWSSTSVGAFASDRWAVHPRVTVDAGVRFDVDKGSAEGAVGRISWPFVAPRVAVRWVPSERRPLAVTTSYGWYRNRLLLDYLSVGDPNASAGTVYRWDDRNGDTRYTQSELTPIAYAGTCCTGSADAAIDPHLGAPYVTEFFIGAEHRLGAWRARMTGVDRREHDAVALVNTGIPLAQYQTVSVADPGIDVDGNSTAQTLTIYGRTPAMFGVDRFTLTNPAGLTSLYQGVDITVDREFQRRYFFRFGGSAYRIKTTGMNRGFLSNENDQGLLGETFLTPNAATSAEGRSFFDRAFVIKISGGYRAPGDVRVGLIARYQDGQPFSRMVIADGLYEGRDVVMAIPRGAQRFTYTFTLDAKVEKTLTFGRRQVGLAVEAFNLTDATIEAEEYVVTGSNFRHVSAVQPPRALRAGVRVGF